MNDFYVENSRQRKRLVRDANTYFQIHIDLVEEADFCLAIRFYNGHTEPLVLPFCNHTWKAEQLGFVLCHEGVRLEAYDGMHVLSSSLYKHPFPVVGAGESFTYHLRGAVDEDVLRFAGCSYDLMLGTTYSIQFHYMAHRSNEILWQF